mmetsp:Transcript_46171/g.109295  ORF Transcript_46171/g.109295 Transcript_46171/m.109295 type:complete len:312 (+) Transcript_46171:311-1246(+)
MDESCDPAAPPAGHQRSREDRVTLRIRERRGVQVRRPAAAVRFAGRSTRQQPECGSDQRPLDKRHLQVGAVSLQARDGAVPGHRSQRQGLPGAAADQARRGFQRQTWDGDEDPARWHRGRGDGAAAGRGGRGARKGGGGDNTAFGASPSEPASECDCSLDPRGLRQGAEPAWRLGDARSESRTARSAGMEGNGSRGSGGVHGLSARDPAVRERGGACGDGVQRPGLCVRARKAALRARARAAGGAAGQGRAASGARGHGESARWRRLPARPARRRRAPPARAHFAPARRLCRGAVGDAREAAGAAAAAGPT